MSKHLGYSFPGETEATLAEVGGKGFSLIEGARAKFPVPAGFILTTHFFDPWIIQLKKTPEWEQYRISTGSDLEEASAALKKAAAVSEFTDEQRSTISGALHHLKKTSLFAVRSSSPNEDLEGASFAGGYETVLGVTESSLEDAVRRCFMSCLDYRVFVYMRQSGFDANDPKIAVVIQTQIASEVSGVGFSINPVTNNYDEAVFNSNWGLGETVVAGIVTPDTFVVDTVRKEIVERRIGTKEISIWLTTHGGTEEKKHFRSTDLSLSDAHIFELARLVKKVEEHYGRPMDIEWAIAEGQLFLLQARPITAYVPLASEMITAAGAQKRLYFDISITAEGMTRPISYMGTSLFRQLVGIVGHIMFLRDITRTIDTAIAHISDGRMFVNLSTFFKLAGKKKISEILSNIDPLAMKVVSGLDEAAYMPAISRFHLLPYGLFLRLPRILLYVWRAKRNPVSAQLDIRESLLRFEREARVIAAEHMPLHQLIDRLIRSMFLEVFTKTVPLVAASRIALGRLERMAGADPDAGKLTRALPHNVTIEMSLALSKIAEFIPDDLTVEDFTKQFDERKLPKGFIDAWSQFLAIYGIRGPEEIDLAAPRYRENPKLLLDLIFAMKQSKGESAQMAFERNQKEREAAFTSMHGTLLAKDPKRAKTFEKDYRFLVAFGGYRETHKYYLVFCIALIREKILAQARVLVTAGRLDSVEQVFDLSIDQLDQAQNDTSLDLRALAKANTVFLKKLARVPRPPSIIDSRGFIPRPPVPPARDGEHVGVAISSGVVQGRVKILHTPNEKPFLKGEILVARATDPGWTPLFVNAAGVVLEVGGVLQHGALVAREYGLPCVAGIEHATELWKDGQLVEVDGSSGIVRIVT